MKKTITAYIYILWRNELAGVVMAKSGAKCWKAFFFAVGFMVFSFVASAQEQNPQKKTETQKDMSGKIFRSRQIGDKAFADGYYSLAIKFYNQYKTEAANDKTTLKDAYFCLFAAYVRHREANNARREFDEFYAAFANEISEEQNLRLRADYWKASIFILEQKYIKATEVFNSIILVVPDKSDLHFESLSGLGLAWTRLLNWEEAEKVYSRLETEGKGTKWVEYARKQKILAVLLKGDLDKARSTLDMSQAGNIADTLLTVFLLAKENKLNEAMELYRKIRNNAQGADSLWFIAVSTLGDACLDKKDFQSAITLLKDAEIFAETDYDRENVMMTLINTYALSKDPENAIEISTRFIKNYPGSVNSDKIRLGLARLCAGSKKTKEAVHAYNEIIENKNSEPGIKLIAAKEAGLLFVSEKLYPEATSKFKYIIDNSKDAKITGEAEFQLAEILFLEKKYEEAGKKLSDIAKIYPEMREATLFKQVKTYFVMKNFDKTLELLDAFMKEFPSGKFYQDSLFLYGMTLLKLRKYPEAQEQFANFAERYPGHEQAPRALFELANISFDNADFKTANETYTKVIEDYRQNPLAQNAVYRRLYSHFLSGDDELAINDIDEMKKNYPESEFTVRGLFWLADYYRDNAKYDTAIEVLGEIAEKYKDKPSFAAAAIYESAFVCIKDGGAGKIEKALKFIDELSEKYPNESILSEGFYLRGDIYSENNEYEKAIPFYIKAAERRPGSDLETACWGRIGDCYFSIAWKTPSDNANIMTSVEYYRKILTKKDVPPAFMEQANYKLAKCEETIGDKGSALAAYREVIYGYQIDIEKGESRDDVWMVKAAQSAARLYLEKETPEAAEAAISMYRKLIEMNIEPRDDFNKSIREIREKFKLKE